MSLPINTASPTLDTVNRSAWMKFCRAMGTQIGQKPVGVFSTPANAAATVTGAGFLGKLLYDVVKKFTKDEYPHFLSGFLTMAFGLSAGFFKFVQNQSKKIDAEIKYEAKYGFRDQIYSAISNKLVEINSDFSDPGCLDDSADSLGSIGDALENIGFECEYSDNNDLQMIRTVSPAEGISVGHYVSSMGRENILYGLELVPMEPRSEKLSQQLFRCSIIQFTRGIDTSWKSTGMKFDNPIVLTSLFAIGADNSHQIEIVVPVSGNQDNGNESATLNEASNDNNRKPASGQTTSGITLTLFTGDDDNNKKIA